MFTKCVEKLNSVTSCRLLWNVILDILNCTSISYSWLLAMVCVQWLSKKRLSLVEFIFRGIFGLRLFCGPNGYFIIYRIIDRFPMLTPEIHYQAKQIKKGNSCVSSTLFFVELATKNFDWEFRLRQHNLLIVTHYIVW